MKVAAGLIVVLAILIGVVPQFTDCESQGRHLVLESGREIPMKCHWTAKSEIALALPLGIVGAVMAFSRRKESWRNLGIASGVLGVAVLLVPTNLIGVCMNPDMICVSAMKPALLLMGGIVTALSLGIVVVSARQREDDLA